MTGLKRGLQIAVALGGLVPVSAGFAGIALGPNLIDDVYMGSISLDSHFRYLSGLLLGVGLLFWSCIPHIERKGAPFRILTAIVVIGGLGRLWGLLVMGVPSPPMLLGLGMELLITPALAVWQWRVEKAYGQ